MKLISYVFCVILLLSKSPKLNITNDTTANNFTVVKAIIPHPNVLNVTEQFSDIKELRLSETGKNYEIAFNAVKDYPFKNLRLSKDKNANVVISSLENNSNIIGAFQFSISSKKISIAANEQEGICNAMSRICQLSVLNGGRLPIVEISDAPQFGYRGMHLDVCRHFFPVSDVKKYIDFLFFYGYNTFHWHLTEDQGWRIEIKKYPKLQEIAAYRNETLIGHYNDQPHQFDGTQYGGFYTQAEVREVVNYAAMRGISVIPEIELPGHSSAALAAYPELGCEPNKNYEVATKWGVFEDIYCPTEKTFVFLEEVLSEVIELFPSKYIHIGGDEAPKAAWKKSAFCQQLIKEKGLEDEHGLQSYFITRIEQFLNSKGKSIIGWDEILEGGLAPNATVMSWRGITGGIEAAKSKHQVIMTPTTHCYFDYYQSDHPDEPLAIGGFLPLEKVYHYDPIPESLGTEFHQFIIGAQGNVWTEYMKKFDQVEYMALARMAALSEVLWCDDRVKNYEQFKNNLDQHINYWVSQNVNIANHLLDINTAITTEYKTGTTVEIKSIPEGATVEYAKPSDATFKLFTETKLTLKENGIYQFKAIRSGKSGRLKTIDYQSHCANFAKITLKNMPHEKYSANGPTSIFNGITGSNEKYGDTEWLGFNDGTNFEAQIEFPEIEKINTLSIRFFKGEGQWIYLPKHFKIFSSADGEHYQLVAETSNIKTNTKVATVVLENLNLATQYLKIEVANFGEIPDGRMGAGHGAWLFVDEIIVSP